MSAANEAWIQDSLARLEQLEAHRQRLAATGHADELAEIDEEIKSLYEVLEAAAAEGAENTAAANQMPAPAPRSAWGDVPHPAFGPAPGMSPSAPVAAPMQSPFAAPMQSPFAAPEPSAAYAEAPAPSFASPSFDASVDDEPRGGSGGIIAVAIVGVLALGGAGYWFLGRPKPVEAPPAAPTDVQVFKAGAIPDDTQEPQVAKGGEADRTPTVTLKVPDDNDRRASRPSSGNNRPSSRSEPQPAAPGKKIKVDASNDPLAGVK